MGLKNSDKKMNRKSKNKHEPVKESENHNEDGGSGGRRGKKLISDPRFASVHSDPRFQKVPRHKSKVEIDSRFNRMFTDKSFSGSSAPSDPRGKAKKQRPESFLRHYYRVEEEVEKQGKEIETKVSTEVEDEESESEEELEKFDDVAVQSGLINSSESEASESDSEEDGEAESTTDEEDDDKVIFEEDDGTDVEEENIPTIEDGTRRLAVVNLDWRHVRAVDLYVVLRSFLPKDGDIVSVAVYPSEFGLQRMKEEEIHGPVGLFDDDKKKKNDNDDDVNEDDDDDDDDEDEDDNDEIDEVKLREYEKCRLRYYYAVVECDSLATAEHLYKSCDGVEFERSSNVFDLRFIPDSMEFKHPPRDVAKEAPTNYEGLDFHTKALQHSNIPISWDEDEPQRVKTLNRKFTADQMAEMELKEYLASDESESDDDDDGAEGEADKKDKKRDKYRALIQSGDGSDGENEDEGQDMEITFHSGLEGLSKRILEKRDKKSETVWEAHLRKQQEKKKARKMKSKHSSEDESSDADEKMTEEEEDDDFFVEEPSVKKRKKDGRAKSDKEEKQVEDTDKEAEATQAELELLLADDNEVDNGVKGYNMKRKKAKGKRGKEVPDENKVPPVDYSDPRFSALFNSPLFALDPTDPQFKRSAAYARQTTKRQHKGDRPEEAEEEHKKQPTKSELPTNEPDANRSEHINSDVVASSKKEKHEISALVRSIKSKSKKVQIPSNGKANKNEKSQFRGVKESEKPELSTLVQSVKKKAKSMKR
ncbi:pre-rRNA-processing protein ESF1 [Mercurialis annua]|uniref:pre-rRNA-processing protein ESF1 n=1 Tax=Mercurialis annua TaxID=3986 RepID=UPI00215FA794|nr:pre-rRNA-processing protein ESF1 [Mercurialis annua]